MSVEAKDIMVFGSANMQDTDSGTQGGAEDKSKKVVWYDLSADDDVEAVSENSGDTTQSITVYGRNAAGELVNETISLNGQTPAQAGSPKTFDRLLKATKSASTSGTVAVMRTTNERADTAQSATASTLVLDAGASATDNAYQFMVLRITGATAGNYQIREIVKYDGSSKTAYVRDWATTPTGTITFEVAEGMVFDKFTSPEAVEIDEVRRPFYNAAANPSGGATKYYYEKVFPHNLHASLALTSAKIDEVDEGAYQKIEFDLESTLDGSDTSTNRLTAPSGYTFDSDEKDVANSGNFSSGSGQGTWLKLTLAGGDAASNSFYKIKTSGQST